MFAALGRILFGCTHRSITFPQSPRHSGARFGHDPYVVCLECGREFRYDWMAMRLSSPLTRRPSGHDSGEVATQPAGDSRSFWTLSIFRLLFRA